MINAATIQRRLGALLSFSFVALTALASIGCRKGPNNPEAPPAENIVYGIEFADKVYAFRETSHRIYIAFTDEANQSKTNVNKWTVEQFCNRAKEKRDQPIVHAYWSGSTTNDKPTIENNASYTNEDPFGTATCTGGTTKAIKPDASDLNLPDLPVSNAIASSSLVEYVSQLGREDAIVSIIVDTGSADGKTEFTFNMADADTSIVGDNSDIPATASTAASTPDQNNIPLKAEFSRTENNPTRIRVNLLGILDPASGQGIKLVADQNIWLLENDEPRGIKVTQGTSENGLPVDVVFVLDNSGSMYQEADAISEKIAEFSEKLKSSGIDVRIGVVGLSGNITGGHNLTDAQTFKEFITAGPKSSRAEKFGGPDAADLEKAAESFDL